MTHAQDAAIVGREIPEGRAIIRRMGWEQDEHGERAFVATLVFPNGPPALAASVVWDAIPVRVVLEKIDVDKPMTIVFPDGSVRDE